MATATVTVGCKLAHGMHLDVDGTRVTLAGRNASSLVNGHGLTHGVDKAFFEEWKKRNHQHPALKNGFIFAYDKETEVAAVAREMEKERTGTEGIDPAKPGDGVEEAEENKAKPVKA